MVVGCSVDRATSLGVAVAAEETAASPRARVRLLVEPDIGEERRIVELAHALDDSDAPNFGSAQCGSMRAGPACQIFGTAALAVAEQNRAVRVAA